MKITPEPDDELMNSLVKETVALPRAAAAQARAQQRARMKTVAITAVMAASVSVAGIWFSKRHAASGEIARTASPSEVFKPSALQGYVKVHQAGEVAGTNSAPPDASERERQLLTELPGIPLLIVRNDAGEVARVHIFER